MASVPDDMLDTYLAALSDRDFRRSPVADDERGIIRRAAALITRQREQLRGLEERRDPRPAASPELEQRVSDAVAAVRGKRTRSTAVGDNATLRVHAINREINREIVESDEVVPGPGLETLAVRDDLGRKLEVAGLACGYGFEVLDRIVFEVVGLGKSRAEVTPAIVSNAKIDASKTYLVVVVEHPDEAIRG